MTFSEQLKHPLWQKKRLEVLELYEFSCADCGSTEKTLHVHHPAYKKGAMLWEYDTCYLMCLCEDCHASCHRLDAAIREQMSILDYGMRELLLGWLKAANYVPDTRLETYEEIIGFLNFFGIPDDRDVHIRPLFNQIIECGGYPFVALGSGTLPISYLDFGMACIFVRSSGMSFPDVVRLIAKTRIENKHFSPSTRDFEGLFQQE